MLLESPILLPGSVPAGAGDSSVPGGGPWGGRRGHIVEPDRGRERDADLSGILMPRRNISSWKVCMSWQSGQRKWCRAELSAWPWGRGGISGVGGSRVPPPPQVWVMLGGDATHLDAAAVEPGAGADGTDQGVVAGPPRHRLQADDTQAVALLQCSQPLCRPVLPAKGPGGQGWQLSSLLRPSSSPAGCPHSLELPEKLGDAAPLDAAGEVEVSGTSPDLAGDRGALLPADAARLGTAGGWLPSAWGSRGAQ